MQKVQPVVCTVAGHSFRFTQTDVERVAQDLTPEPLRDHYAVVGGIRFPPKQLLAAATRVDRADFTTNQARAILRRLGFATGRIGEAPRRARRTAEAAAPYRSSDADFLRPYRGKWVALKEGEVLASAETPEGVLAWLRKHDRRGDAMFRVPLDPGVDLGGFPG